MTKQVYDDLKELEAAYKKLTCSIQQAFNSTELKSESAELTTVIHGKWELTQRGRCTDLYCSVCNTVRVKDYSYNSAGYTLEELDELRKDIKNFAKENNMNYCEACGARMDKE